MLGLKDTLKKDLKKINGSLCTLRSTSRAGKSKRPGKKTPTDYGYNVSANVDYTEPKIPEDVLL